MHLVSRPHHFKGEFAIYRILFVYERGGIARKYTEKRRYRVVSLLAFIQCCKKRVKNYFRSFFQFLKRPHNFLLAFAESIQKIFQNRLILPPFFQKLLNIFPLAWFWEFRHFQNYLHMILILSILIGAFCSQILNLQITWSWNW